MAADQSLEAPVLFKFLGVAVPTSGAPVDLASVAGNSLNRFYIKDIVIADASARTQQTSSPIYNASFTFGTMAAATFAIYTGAGATGTAVMSAQATSSLTAANTAQAMTVTVPYTINTYANSSLYLRCTVASANAGYVDVYVLGYPLNY